MNIKYFHKVCKVFLLHSDLDDLKKKTKEIGDVIKPFSLTLETPVIIQMNNERDFVNQLSRRY